MVTITKSFCMIHERTNLKKNKKTFEVQSTMLHGEQLNQSN